MRRSEWTLATVILGGVLLIGSAAPAAAQPGNVAQGRNSRRAEISALQNRRTPEQQRRWHRRLLDRREDVRDRREDRRDRREDVRDRREDRWDRRHDGGRRDRIEDRWDRREDVRDRREDVRDRREDRRDRRHGVIPRPRR